MWCQINIRGMETMNVCKNTCERFKGCINKQEKYEDGRIAYCKTCSFMYYKKDIINNRCPCCNTIMRTHKRQGKKPEVHRY